MRNAALKSIGLAAAALLMAGCQNGHYGSKDDPHDASIKVPSIDNTYEMVGVGKPPLALIITSGGWIKVVDATEGTLVHTAQLPPTSGGLIVRIDPEMKAITYSNTSDKSDKPTLILPIDPEHRFELYYQR